MSVELYMFYLVVSGIISFAHFENLKIKRQINSNHGFSYIFLFTNVTVLFSFALLAVVQWVDQHQLHQLQLPNQPQQRRSTVAGNESASGHVCENCGKVYKQKNALWRHFKYECGKPPRFQCPYCRYRTKQRSNMYTHIKHRHHGLKIYVVDLGPDSAASPQNS